MKFKKLSSIMMVAILSVGLLSGCSNSSGKDKDTSSGGSDKPKVLTIATGRSFYQGEGTDIFVHGSTNVWESLVKLQDDMTPACDLAESIEPSEDYMSWTIKVKKGIKFHDGTELNAKAVKYNLDRLYHFSDVDKKYDKKTENVDDYGKIKSIELVDDYTVKVTHKEPTVDFMARLSYAAGAMFSLESFNDDGQIVKPYGTGPFKLKDYDETSDVLTLEKFADYRNGKAKLDEVVFKKIEDASTRLSALQTGEIDVVADVGAIMPQQADKVKSDDKLELKEQLVTTTHYMNLNKSKGKLFNNNDLAQAVSYAVSSESIVKDLLQGYGKEAKSVITSVSKKYSKDCGYEYNMDKAKELKEKSIGDKKESIDIIINSALTGRWPYENVAMLIQSQLEKIDIKSNIEVVDAAVWSERLKKGDYDMTLAPYTISTGEPSFYFEPHMKSDGAINVSRSYGYKNSKTDELIAKAATETDEQKRVKDYQELQDIAKKEGPTIPLWEDVTLYAVNKKVKDFNLNLLFWSDLSVVDIEK
ncbi:ABC transporter substrate-binding protein [Terrisporobacter glycolicus]|nr:ABC transporter substrate-binding protein [Terrisporobacter glycolicus]